MWEECVVGMDSQSVAVSQLSLTVGKSLMYYPRVEVFYLLPGTHGRLLKLVDRADLGSVGDEP